MKAQRISKDYYVFLDENNYPLGNDSYTNQLQYRETLTIKLAEVNQRISEIEKLGFAEDDLKVETEIKPE